ncbi:hypothetical protein SGUI_2629 [Serinicoccus hydrothermalis]|uniref:Uncharacterized protein n=1 Tax=Serinicoccus hydrothermalis TaxID=1758689 RepID=A0A1B1NF71_9MICO|nr:hypothetical protein SGUI_2629 [Serinicoccus hydrothermalis]
MRLASAALVLAAVLAQARVTLMLAVDGDRDLVTTVVNFVSFFTILSNASSVVVLAWAGVWLLRRRGASDGREPAGLAVALACVTT